MTFAESTLRWQRWLLAAMLFAAAIVLVPTAVEPFMLPKVTVVVALALALVVVGAARALWTRQVHLPLSPVTWAVGAFALALVVTTATSPTPLASVIGFYGRYTGLVPYLAYVLVFLVALRVTDLAAVRLLTRTALVALGLVVLYGLLQTAGVDVLDFNDIGLGTNFSFLGNIDFSGAWAGAVSGLALATVVAPGEHRSWRIYAAVLAPVTLLYTVLTGTSQGPVVAVVSLGWVVLLVGTAADGRVRRALVGRRGLALGVAGGLAVALGVALVAALPSLRAQLDQAFVERPEFWAAALGIFADNPVVGSGLDTYAHHFQEYRPASHALANGVATTDAPHSVPLGMLSNGGLLLGLSYAAVVVLVAVALVRGAVRATGPTRIGLAGWGGVWLGYQAQSLISFDVPPLALLHWLSAGIIVALAAPPRWRTIALPGQPATRPVNRKGKEYGAFTVPTSTKVLQGATALLALAALWLVAYPLRADLVAASAEPLANSGRISEAIERFDRAATLNPAEASYPFLSARGHDAADRHAEAFEAAAEAARRDPGTVQYALFAARQAADAGQAQAALQWYREAAERDPRNPPVLTEAGNFLLQAADVAAAEALLERSVALRAEPINLVVLGNVRTAQGDVESARDAFSRALELEPGNEAAQRGLASLPTSS